MSTYCMSDIHGHQKEFEEMLKLIEFSDEDTLYILGDIIDRGPESAEMLLWAVNDAPDNIKFLYGNHEDLAYSIIKIFPKCPMTSVYDAWGSNDGTSTLDCLYLLLEEKGIGREWFTDKLIPWLESLPLYEKVSVDTDGGKKDFMLVHAGFSPVAFNTSEDSKPKLDRYCDFNPEDNARNEFVYIDDEFGKQFSQAMLWERVSWLCDSKPAPIDTVFGHTYLEEELIDAMNAYDVEATGGNGRIAHIVGNKHSIDCGMGRAYSCYDESKRSQYNLGCLRLEDMQEFYIVARIGDEGYLLD